MFEISKLKEKKLSELQEIAEELKISKYKTLKKLDLVYKILDHQASNPDEKESDKKIHQNQVLIVKIDPIQRGIMTPIQMMR